MFFLSNRTCRTGLSRFGKLTFPRSADSQFLKTADCDYSEICRNKVTAYNQSIPKSDVAPSRRLSPDSEKQKHGISENALRLGLFI